MSSSTPSPRHVAVFVFADFGHVNPTLGLARELVARGHRVTYVVDRRFTEPIERTGARVVGYDSARGAFYRAPDPTHAQLAADGYQLLLESMETVFPLALAAFRNDPPDLVLYDFESFAAGRVAAHVLGAASVQLCPSHASNETFSMRARMFPADEALMRDGALAFIDFMEAHGIGTDQLARYGTEWDRRNLVFLPREFQIEGETFDDRYAFVGPSVAEPDGAVPWSPPRDGRRLALVSLGTESTGQRDLLRACAEAFDGADWQVVMTLGRGGERPWRHSLPPHVETHEWLPHPAVLPHADILVCHGGMGSIMEALYFATPVVAVPQVLELSLSAQRLADLGLGRMVPHQGLTAATLARAVEGVLLDPGTPERLAWMRERVRGAGGAVRAADLLERWAAEPVPVG
ncbi:macrolide family glycosyltransferase [Peterkaempfera bronchialis]|uniref:Glycosyl transferase n=1 Tax=Peterkaempfera bronchialis TaxID=2126346 RepID=A0A345T2W7_9ACTN|nr:macrolide family glycosyltransferase [Peterkaempfera bronchialis]AXI80322.1 glycosyl transferase [Peterkaempfera bronchialis]